MQEAKRPLFQTDALQRYTQQQEATVLPRLVSRRAILRLWLLLGLLVAGGCLAWLAWVSVYASGSAVVVDGSRSPLPTRPEALVVAFMPPEYLRRLRVGQTLRLQLDERSAPLATPITAAEPGIRSPELARGRFGLGEGAALAIAHPSAIALARLQPFSSGLPTAAYVAGVHCAQIEVDSRRVISLLPVIGPFFGE